jgi:hypothetical protein
VVTVAARNADEAVLTLLAGRSGVRLWPVAVVRRSVPCWCVWHASGFSRREDVFMFHLLLKEVFCAFSAICKDNDAINCITVQHKEGSFLSTLSGRNCVNNI